MNIITISREFGSGGRELGKRLADQLSCDYYDSEIISAVAQTSGMDAAYIESTAKLKRCMERAPKSEKLTEKELLRKMKQIDKVRSQTRELMSGSAWEQREAYHIIVNTTEWNIK